MCYLLACLVLLAMTQVSYAQFAWDEDEAEEVLACLRKGLNAKTLRRISGGMGGGLINTGQGFIINNTKWVQIKCNYKDKVARPMFEGEMAGLNLLRELNLTRIKIAKPYQIIDLPYMKGGACIVIDYLFTDSLDDDERQRDIGTALAHIHLHNARMKAEQPDKYVPRFGFNISTYCGRIPQDNEWKDTWLDFLMNNRLKYQIDLLRKRPNSEEACYLWDFKLKPHLHKLFENITVEPALLHGDFWFGNVGQKKDETDESQIYDPAVFYGHHEYDLAAAKCFPGFTDEFFNAYHAVIPKTPGFDDRQRVYQLFHFMNHWNQYGLAYYYDTVNMMRDICLSLNLRGVNYRKIEDDYADVNRIKPDGRPRYLRTKAMNKSALFNTTRNRGRRANWTKTTTPRPLFTKLTTKWVKKTKVYIDSEDQTDPPMNGTSLSLKQIYHIFYQPDFDWCRKKKRK